VEEIVGLRLVCGMTIVLLSSCNRPADYALVGSAYVPSTQGDIRVEKIDKDQILINITLDHLPAPDRIEPGLTRYVVWFTPVGEPPARQQALDYDAGTEVGRASIPTSLREFEVQVTAEANEAPQKPSVLLVASQTIREN
jgi:hypothetical protein